MNSIERKVLEIIGEDPDAPDVFSDDDEGMAPIRDSINDAIQEITILAGGKVRRYFLPLREGQMFYRFAITDAWSHNQQYRLEQTSYRRLSSADPRWMTTTSDPRSYFMIGHDVVGVWPKPSASSNILAIEVVEIPEPYEGDADRISLREELHYAAVHYAVSEFWASRGDAREAETHMGYYLAALGLKERLGNKDASPRVATVKAPYPRETN
jgi:hypothetical protein